MRRGLQRTFTVASAASAVLLAAACLVACVMWVRSYHAHDRGYLTADRPGSLDVAWASDHGTLYLEAVSNSRRDLRLLINPSSPPVPIFDGAGFLYLSYDERLPGSGGTEHVREWGLPYWFVCAAAMLLPAAYAARSVRRRGSRPRHVCRACGYDLRATPEAGGAVFDRCPECGAVAAQRRPQRAARHPGPR